LTLENKTNVADESKTIWEVLENGLAEILAVFFMALVVALRKLPGKIKRKKDRKLIIHDLEKHARAFSETQDLVDETQAVYGWGILYHNHGPEKLTVMFECLGHACNNCQHPCSFQNKRKRIQSSWINRPIHKFWLENLALKTLKLNGKVNTVRHDEASDFQQEIFDNIGVHTVKEVFIKTKTSHEFITVCFAYCENYEHNALTDPALMGLANKLYRYL